MLFLSILITLVLLIYKINKRHQSAYQIERPVLGVLIFMLSFPVFIFYSCLFSIPSSFTYQFNTVVYASKVETIDFYKTYNRKKQKRIDSLFYVGVNYFNDVDFEKDTLIFNKYRTIIPSIGSSLKIYKESEGKLAIYETATIENFLSNLFFKIVAIVLIGLLFKFILVGDTPFLK